MKLLVYIEKYQNAIIGTLLIHVLVFVWLNIQSVSFYVIKPIEKTVATLDYTEQELNEIIEQEINNEKLVEVNVTNVSSNFDQNKPLDKSQKEQLKEDVIKDLKKFEEDQFNELNKDNPTLLNNPEEKKEKLNENTVINKSVEKMAAASTKYLLKDRHMIYQKIPSYLCNAYGVVRIDIKVNQKGIVTDCKVNSKHTNTTNDCLIDNAIEYTKQWRFNSDFNQSIRASGWVEFVYLSQ